ncbi:MAS20-domain-containing protein [Basidiobolus meristosporus CBS 931.73]|uniref:Large ribosomal subunit protein bL35c n=1 Tax=Basidiobolus meristosporus CBS 931.73 TaxID=1314790 RepID=A0A1Y1YIX1_9FUNG|nr:MAS20-domain-containing protein [Basidiobolus meristosporus CBS 931.73]|eukprot:ORX97977.1 MAS20-domain-containing protein [Basidiobolus meristosporus CBS 931.73]
MKSSTAAWIAAGLVVATGVGYAVYFDQKRRNDPKFRKQLSIRARRRLIKPRRLLRRIWLSQAAQKIADCLAKVASEPLPITPEEKEQYFMTQVGKGEQLAAVGEQGYDEAAVCFFKALKVYPSPIELVMIYQKTVPEPVFNLVMGMMSLELKQKQEKFYEVFPPKGSNVELKELIETVEEGKKIAKRISPLPRISLRVRPSTPKSLMLLLSSLPLKKVAFTDHHQALCTGNTSDPDSKAEEFFKLSKENKIPIMIAKYLTHMVYEENQKLAAGVEDEYSAWDHLERLKYLEIVPTEKEEQELQATRDLLSTKVPGMEEFLNDERFLLLKGKMMYNAIGITSQDEEAVNDGDNFARSDRQGHVIGAGLYKISSYANHTCEPNARVTFPKGDRKLALVATKPLKAGDQLFITYVKIDGRKHSERKEELVKKYRLKCECDLCKNGVDPESTSEEKPSEIESLEKEIENALYAEAEPAAEKPEEPEVQEKPVVSDTTEFPAVTEAYADVVSETPVVEISEKPAEVPETKDSEFPTLTEAYPEVAEAEEPISYAEAVKEPATEESEPVPSYAEVAKEAEVEATDDKKEEASQPLSFADAVKEGVPEATEPISYADTVKEGSVRNAFSTHLKLVTSPVVQANTRLAAASAAPAPATGSFLLSVPMRFVHNYKLKTHKGTQKRWRKTGNGLFKRQQVGKRHLNTSMSPKRGRHLRKTAHSNTTQRRVLEKLMPYA